MAGDQLVTTCPSWQWKSAANDKLVKPELPKDKQYLYSQVPCQKRVRDLIKGESTERDVRISKLAIRLNKFKRQAMVGL